MGSFRATSTKIWIKSFHILIARTRSRGWPTRCTILFAVVTDKARNGTFFWHFLFILIAANLRTFQIACSLFFLLIIIIKCPSKANFLSAQAFWKKVTYIIEEQKETSKFGSFYVVSIDFQKWVSRSG